ncbi:MAG: hypothetical protein ACI4IR_03820 [Eubacterium sp.]
MELLLILEIIIVVSFIITSVFMFAPKGNEAVHKIFFAMAILLGILVTYMDASSLPSNYVPQIIIAWLGLLPAALGVILTVANGKPTVFAKILAMATTIFGVCGYLFML